LGGVSGIVAMKSKSRPNGAIVQMGGATAASAVAKKRCRCIAGRNAKAVPVSLARADLIFLAARGASDMGVASLKGEC
jgi:hypothetical protein